MNALCRILLLSGGVLAALSPGQSMAQSDPKTLHVVVAGELRSIDPEMERLRAAWVRETDPVKARWLAEDIQLRGMQIVVYIPFGQYLAPSAWRDSLQGLLQVPETVVFWNITKKS
jgi:ABC-type transport system substrate-binding protein